MVMTWLARNTKIRRIGQSISRRPLDKQTLGQDFREHAQTGKAAGLGWVVGELGFLSYGKGEVPEPSLGSRCANLDREASP